jgi:hypothetical protein
LEIWYGKQFCHWELKVVSLVNGHLVGKDCLELSRSVPGNAYLVEDLEGHSLLKALNGKYLKCYYPSMWQDRYEDYCVKED